MRLRHIFEPACRFFDYQAQLHPDKIASAEYFKVMIQRERALADRNGRRLALLVYHIDKAPIQEVSQLVTILEKRIRETDDIGWLASDGIGVLLRQTDYGGAQDLAQNLNFSLMSGHLAFDWHILCYPEQKPGMTASDTQVKPLGYGVLHSVHSGRAALPPVNPGTEADATLAPDDTPPTQDLLMMVLLAKPIPRWKRLTDIIVSATTLILLSPLLILISIGIVLVAPGPVLFQQERIGYLGRRFMCLKFRSMKTHAPTDIHRTHLQQLIHSDAPMKKLDEAKDDRIIPMGRFLRACALDELPQLINVLRGDMSLVGPRPCLAYEFETFLRWHKRRFDTLPGLTGLWQVSGKNKTSFGEMMRLDITYERRRSFLFDLMIISKTPMVLAEQMMETICLPTKEHTYESAH